jgi:hypothetical protein
MAAHLGRGLVTVICALLVAGAVGTSWVGSRSAPGAPLAVRLIPPPPVKGVPSSYFSVTGFIPTFFQNGHPLVAVNAAPPDCTTGSSADRCGPGPTSSFPLIPSPEVPQTGARRCKHP